MPEISIVIPVHNRLHFLGASIASCLIQAFRDFDILIVDDGSTEPVQEIFAQIPAGLRGAASIRYIRQSHQGASAARNRGVQESTGEFIQFLDSDDLLHPAKLAVQRERLRESTDLDMAFALDEYFHIVPGDTRLLWNAPDERSYLDRFLWDDPVWNTGSPLWRRAALDRIGPWDETLLCWQDWEFHIRALCRDLRSAHIPVVLQYIREHAEARSTNVNSAKDREESKFGAALAVANELTTASLWNRRRGDALAVFLVSIAENLDRINEAAKSREILRYARAYSSALSLKVVCGLMLMASATPTRLRIGRWAPVRLVYRLAKTMHLLSIPPSSWHALPSEAQSAPPALTDVMAVAI